MKRVIWLQTLTVFWLEEELLLSAIELFEVNDVRLKYREQGY
jgi:hypothetical protein